MKYIGLDLHKRNIFATVLDGDGKILSRANIRSKKEDISYYLKSQGSSENLSIAIEASYNWLYYYKILEGITDNIVVAHPLTQLSIYIHNSRLKQTILAFFWSLQPL